MADRLPIRGPYAHEIPPDPFTRGPYAQGNGFGVPALEAKGLILNPWVVSGNPVTLEIDNTATADGSVQMQFYCKPLDGPQFTVNETVAFTSGMSGEQVCVAIEAVLEANYALTVAVTVGTAQIALTAGGTIYAPPFLGII